MKGNQNISLLISLITPGQVLQPEHFSPNFSGYFMMNFPILDILFWTSLVHYLKPYCITKIKYKIQGRTRAFVQGGGTIYARKKILGSPPLATVCLPLKNPFFEKILIPFYGGRLGDVTEAGRPVLRGLEVILQILRFGGHFCGDHGASAPPPSLTFRNVEFCNGLNSYLITKQGNHFSFSILKYSIRPQSIHHFVR